MTREIDYPHLFAFYAARLAEDEDVARHADNLAWAEDPATAWFGGSAGSGEPTVCMWPARALGDVAAKRGVLEFVQGVGATAGEPPHWDTLHAGALRHVVRLLAVAYAEHPDYREEWKP